MDPRLRLRLGATEIGSATGESAYQSGPAPTTLASSPFGRASKDPHPYE